MNWSLVTSGLFLCKILQVCCNSAVVHGLSIVVSAMFVTVGGIMGVVPAVVAVTL